MGGSVVVMSAVGGDPEVAVDPVGAAALFTARLCATAPLNKATATTASAPPVNIFFNVTPSPTTRGTKPKRARQVFLSVLAARGRPVRIVYSRPRHPTH
jgi:hypothetical protein